MTCADRDSSAAGLLREQRDAASQQHGIVLVADCQRLQHWWLSVRTAGTPVDRVCCPEGMQRHTLSNQDDSSAGPYRKSAMPLVSSAGQVVGPGACSIACGGPMNQVRHLPPCVCKLKLLQGIEELHCALVAVSSKCNTGPDAGLLSAREGCVVGDALYE